MLPVGFQRVRVHVYTTDSYIKPVSDCANAEDITPPFSLCSPCPPALPLLHPWLTIILFVSFSSTRVVRHSLPLSHVKIEKTVVRYVIRAYNTRERWKIVERETSKARKSISMVVSYVSRFSHDFLDKNGEVMYVENEIINTLYRRWLAQRNERTSFKWNFLIDRFEERILPWDTHKIIARNGIM